MKQWNQEEWAGKTGVAGMTEQAGAAGLEPEDTKRACSKAVYYLQYSAKTENELRKKLAEQGFLPASVDKAVEYVKMRRYLNDEDYVRRYMETNGNKKSRKQMSYELRRKGIAEEILELVFEEMPVDEKEQIRRILAKRGYDGKEIGYEEKRKLSAYLARKGFSYDTIHAVLELW